MSGELGRASLDLEANLGSFERNLEDAHAAGDRLQHALDALAAVADVCQKALNDVKLSETHAAESRLSAEQILAGVSGISDESRSAALALDRVKLGSEQAVETDAAGDVIDHKLDEIRDKAIETRSALDRVKLGAGRLSVGGTSLPLIGAGIGAGVLAAPAAAPAALGLLAGIPTIVGGAAGALGTLALAFDGVTKAIGGDKKAFDDLGPSAKQFVLTVRSLDGWFDKLRQTAGAALFPGLTAGLKAALSPGTVAAITKAVTELGHALGAAGAAWGRYFGSREFQSIFGPLMASAARNIGVLSDAFLHLFDALGVIAKAAIPFTNWLASAIDKGARLADSWTHAQAASGGLARAMSAAETSLTLVAHAFGALFNVAAALGKALYPVSNVALKDLIDGLNGLAGVIRRNQKFIRDLVGGALKVLVVAVKAAADGIGVIFHALKRLVGEKAVVIGAITAISAILLSELGPNSLAIGGAIIAVGLIKEHWKTIEHFFVNLGHEIVNAFEYVWYLLEKGALKAALAVVEPFSHLPSFLGGWARKAKDSMQAQLDKLHAPNMAWGSYAQKAGVYTGGQWRQGFLGATAGIVSDAFKAVGTAIHAATHHHHRRKPSSTDPTLSPPSPGPAPGVFGTPPPFTSSGSGSTHHRRHHLSAAQRAQERLQFALDRAKEAVQVAQQGSKAYDRAVKAEEKALHAEINYWAKRAHNLDLSLKARDAALRKELSYQRQLKSLLNSTAKATAQAASANEAQFLQTWNDIQNAFAPNATPIPGQPPSGKTDTHLYDIKNELRQQTPLLKKAVHQTRFPGSAAASAAAAVVG